MYYIYLHIYYAYIYIYIYIYVFHSVVSYVYVCLFVDLCCVFLFSCFLTVVLYIYI